MKLSPGSVRSAHIKNGQVKSADIADGSIAARDLKKGLIPGIATGVGTTGAAGEQRARSGPAVVVSRTSGTVTAGPTAGQPGDRADLDAARGHGR